MRYPTLTDIPNSREMVNAFYGYNHNYSIGNGEFYDEKNMTSAYFPLLSPRGKRGVYASPASANGLIAKDSICYVDGHTFKINGHAVEGLTLTDSPKQLISMGAYVIIMPDKMYINTADTTDYGPIEASFTTQADVVFKLCNIDGETYDGTTTGESAPDEPSNQDYWLDTSTTPHELKQWSANTSMWVTVPTTYIRIESPGIGVPFEQYDGVKISGVEMSELSDLNANMVIWAKGDDYIVVIGILDATTEQSAPITITRRMPNMDYITESNNRLWGCRYGLSVDGEVVNEIYSCKLGDFKNWNCFMGLSTDSYVASCGTDGQFTGAITHLGYPLFFKENFLHKVYGNYPSNFSVQSTACRGVQRGSDKSLAIVNEGLYYKGINGVCLYDGSLPREISDALGEVSYTDAVGGGHGNKYYISMKDKSNAWHMFVFDTKSSIWHREDNTQAEQFCSCGNEMYYIDHASGDIKTVFGSGVRDTEPVEWMVQSGVIGTNMPDKKYISRLLLRMSLQLGTEIEGFIQYDSVGHWERMFKMRGKTLRTFTIPVHPHRCDHFRIRIVGKGEAKLYSVTKTIEQGSDV